MIFRKQKFISFILIISLCLAILTGCDKVDQSQQKEYSKNSQDEKLLLRIAHAQVIDSPEDIAVNEFAKVLKEQLGDKIEIEVYPAMQIGSIPEMMESTQMGAIEMCMANTAILSTFCDDMKLIDLPYVLPKEVDVIDKVLNHTEEGDEYLGRLDSAGFKGLGFWFLGHRMMSTTNKEVRTPSDLKGLKMRIMESPILVDMYNSWGASAVPISYAELYNSLQQGVVEGQENPVQSIYLSNLHEVQDYVFSTYHATQTHILIANAEWYNSLDEETQAAIEKAEYAGREKLNEILPSYQQKYLDGIIESGTTYYELTDSEILEFKKTAPEIYKKNLKTDWQKEFFPKLLKRFEEEADNNG